MNGREIIKAIVDHKECGRFGANFIGNHLNDFTGAAMAACIPNNPDSYYAWRWGDYEDLRKQVPWFTGELTNDIFGNIYGRFNGRTKGECVKGVLQDGWESLDRYIVPKLDKGHRQRLLDNNFKASDKYVLAGAPVSIFSNLRDARLMGNALMDTALEPDMVKAFLHKLTAFMLEVIDGISDTGIDGVMMGDDWGTQDRTFISAESFRDIFKPSYKRIADALHERGIKLFFHSCGNIYNFIEDFIDAGVDVFQFDQPELCGSERFARRFGARACLFSPVDIQKIMPTGNRELIEKAAHDMLKAFRDNCAGSLIVKDYPSWGDIGVENEWADWARNALLSEISI